MFKKALTGYVDNEKITFIPGRKYSIFCENGEYFSSNVGIFEKYDNDWIYLSSHTGIKRINMDLIVKVIDMEEEND